MAEDRYVYAPGGWCAPSETFYPISMQGPSIYDGIRDEEMPTVVRGGDKYEISFTFPSLEVVAIMTNIPLVDLSIDYDTHIIRGEQ